MIIRWYGDRHAQEYMDSVVLSEKVGSIGLALGPHDLGEFIWVRPEEKREAATHQWTPSTGWYRLHAEAPHQCPGESGQGWCWECNLPSQEAEPRVTGHWSFPVMWGAPKPPRGLFGDADRHYYEDLDGLKHWDEKSRRWLYQGPCGHVLAEFDGDGEPRGGRRESVWFMGTEIPVRLEATADPPRFDGGTPCTEKVSGIPDAIRRSLDDHRLYVGIDPGVSPSWSVVYRLQVNVAEARQEHARRVLQKEIEDAQTLERERADEVVAQERLNTYVVAQVQQGLDQQRVKAKAWIVDHCQVVTPPYPAKWAIWQGRAAPDWVVRALPDGVSVSDLLRWRQERCDSLKASIGRLLQGR